MTLPSEGLVKRMNPRTFPTARTGSRTKDGRT
jgi:hypothetical protein